MTLNLQWPIDNIKNFFLHPGLDLIYTGPSRIFRRDTRDIYTQEYRTNIYIFKELSKLPI